MKIKVAEYIAKFFSENGIEHIFTITGGGAMHLNDAFGHHDKIKCIYNHHEQASAIAAEAYTRLTNKLAGVCVTSGPGGTNAITGVLGGWLDSIPMFVVSGQVKMATTVSSTELPLRQLGDQEFDIVSCVKTMTKYAKMITSAEEIRYHLEKALYLALNGRPGPVWLDIPLDIQAAIIDTENLKGYDWKEDIVENSIIKDDKIFDDILEKIKNSKRPVILAGSGIRLSGCHKEFIELVEKLNIPVVTAWNAHDNLWDDHRLYCGRPGTIGTRGGNFVVQNSDLLISLGCRLNIRQISYNWEEFAKKAYKIVVDIDEAELMKPTLKIDMPIHANVKDIINGLLHKKINLDIDKHKEWLRWSKNINIEYPVVLKDFYKTSVPVNPYVFMRELFECLEENEVIVTGNGSACVCSFQAAYLQKGQRLFTNSGCASMGYGLPAAFGASVALNGKRVICLDGDGSIQMNIQELQTIVHHKSNMKIFWLNNDGYHSIRQTQTNLFKGNLVGINGETGLSIPEAERIALAYGIKYFKIHKHEELKDIVDKVIMSDGPVICEVVLDSGQNFEPKLSSKVLPNGDIVSPSIDDMYPFLEREEYEKNILR
ncbi:thiamine pyrophosphate-binding protein [Clostridium sp. LP20]|uniref:thiamine pyrophosphate-binding protein n=1 Tax=Clostridium sp. LP20 TaxID=3418665 RepID=UPI003EE7B374